MRLINCSDSEFTFIPANRNLRRFLLKKNTQHQRNKSDCVRLIPDIH